jgi:uncharacterized damage-inducible protein DinB
MEELRSYKARGARASILLHEKHLRQCVEVWKQAKAVNLNLPATDNEHYQSLETLLQHILDSAGHYMVWMCEQLGLPDPEIRPVPDVDKIETEADNYLEHVLERWRLPLAKVSEEKFDAPTYIYYWDVGFTIGAMLEHALVHPIRHQFQLEALIVEQTSER